MVDANQQAADDDRQNKRSPNDRPLKRISHGMAAYADIFVRRCTVLLAVCRKKVFLPDGNGVMSKLVLHALQKPAESPGELCPRAVY